MITNLTFNQCSKELQRDMCVAQFYGSDVGLHAVEEPIYGR